MKRIKLYYVIASGVLASTGVFAAMQLTSSDAQSEIAQIDVVRMLDEKRVTLQDISGTTTEAIDVLRHKYGAPVSFISIADEKPKTVQFGDEEVSLREALDQFVQMRERYTYSLVCEHLVIYPKSGPFNKVIGGVDIRNAPRWEATYAFVEHLKQTNAGFRSLVPPVIRGDPHRAPVYADRVSLPEEATVLEQFAALLGDNSNVMFSIVDWRSSGKRFFVLEELKRNEAKRPAKPKDLRTTEPGGD